MLKVNDRSLMKVLSRANDALKSFKTSTVQSSTDAFLISGNVIMMLQWKDVPNNSFLLL